MVAQNGRECADACKLQGEGCMKQATGSMALCVVMAMDRSFASAAHDEASVVCHDRGLWLPPGDADCGQRLGPFELPRP